MKLVIFDLDQTLVDFADLHNEVTHRLLKKHLGIDAWLTEIDYAGTSQRDGMWKLARMKGVSEAAFESKIDLILEQFGPEFTARMPAGASGNLLPGAWQLLEDLSKTDNLLVLYTGDAPSTVDAIFKATGLGRFFRFRFSGTDFPRREDMVARAIQQAEAAAGRKFVGKDVVIIGDSLRDVECGLKFNALIIGVTTGYHTEADLKTAGADLVVGSLLEHDRILEAIGRVETGKTPRR